MNNSSKSLLDTKNNNNNVPSSKSNDEKEEIDIMALLHQKKLNIIERAFHEEGKGLSLDSFVKIMLEHLDYPPELTNKVALNLIELFKEIDVNGDATMEWEEFSNHIIELGLIKKDRNVVNVIKTYNNSDCLIDRVKHYTEIEKVYFFEKPKYLFVLERDSPNFKVYDSNNATLLGDIPAHKGAVLAADCYQDENGNDLIVTTSNDLTINFWEGQNFTLKQRVSTPEIQHCIKHVKWSTNVTANYIYTGGSDAIIHYYDAKTLKQKGHLSGWNPFAKRDVEQNGHAGPISELLPIHQQLSLVSAGLDGQICLWDIPSHTFKKELKGHEKGVYSLDWCDEYNFLISAGLDHEAYVWNTYVKEKILMLRGHNHPLVSVKCIPHTPQIVSADISGMVKIWDVRNFMCVQTFNVPVDELNTFTVTYPKKVIVTGSKSLSFYEYDEPKDQLLTDEKMCLKVLYNEVLFCFITLHPNTIKIWEAKTGKLSTMHRDVSKRELSSMCLDERKRKLLIGDVGGRIYCINIKNGARMKKFEKHENEKFEPEQITDISYWKTEPDPKVVSASKGTTVKVSDDSTSDYKCRYKMESHTQTVNALALNKEHGMIASCSDDGSIVIMNLISYRQDGILRKNYIDEEDDNIKLVTSPLDSNKKILNQTEIKKIIFLSPHPYLVSSDSSGRLSFWAVYPNPNKNNYICSIYYYAPSFTKTLERFPIASLAYDSERKYLLLGDEFGNLSVWDISKLIDKMDIITHDFEKMKLLKIKREHLFSEFSKKGSVVSNDGVDSNKKVAFITAHISNGLNENDIPGQNDIKILIQCKKFHNDGITHIEIIEGNNCFATSSYDCCCHIWNYQGLRIGSLILGRGMVQLNEKDDRVKWNFDIKDKEQQRELENEEEGKKLIEEIQKGPVNETHRGIFSEKKKLKPKQSLQSNSIALAVSQAIHEKELEEDKSEQDLNFKDKYEGKAYEKKSRILDNARKVLDKYNGGTYGMFMNEEIGEGKDIFIEDDEDDQDYHILHDLDFKTNNLNILNKAIFKSKPTKAKVKAKLK